MWSTYLTFLLVALTASSLASPSPLTTSATTVATLSELQPGNAHNGILIHVLRTEDLIADKLKSKPLLLERLSHLLIRVELGNQSVAVNDHPLPIVPGARPLEVSVKLKQVQMLKMPKDSPLVPLGLTPPEVLSIADKYMSQGIVAAMLSVTQEPLTVEAMREDHTPVKAEAYKVTIGIKILEVDGMSLAETDLQAVDLLHLIVHPDQTDPTKVATLTTLAPEALSTLEPNASLLGSASVNPAGILSAAIDSTRASLASTLNALGNAMRGVASHASGLLGSSRARKPCHKHHHHHPHPHPNPHTKPAEPKHVESAAATKAPAAPQEPVVGRHSAVSNFNHRMRCFVKMVARSSLAVLLLGLPLALVLLVLSTLVTSLLRRRLERSAAAASQTVPPAYESIPTDEKLSEEPKIIIIHTTDADKI